MLLARGRSLISSFILSGVAAGILAGCSTGARIADRDPALVFEDACRPGAASTFVEGSVWIRTQSATNSKESGQFPADVRVSEKTGLVMQVTNLIGGREAEIRVSDNQVRINGQSPARDGQGGMWSGIPLRFAPELFLGRVPCPPVPQRKGAKIAFNGERELTVQAGGEEYRYRFREVDRKLLPTQAQWRAGDVTIDFTFDDLELATGSARKWEARGPAGEVKVKWRERHVEAQ